MKNKTILNSAFIALFAAIICFSCFVTIPIGPVPIVIQNMVCILCGTLLGFPLGCVPTALFLLAGLIGLPVYSGGTSGIAVWMGPTGGFLWGYFFGALVANLIAGKPKLNEIKKFDGKNYVELASFLRVIFALIVGNIVIYIPGLIHFASWAAKGGKVPEDSSLLSYTLGACLTPFLPGAVIKLALIIPIALILRPIVAQYLYSDKK